MALTLLPENIQHDLLCDIPFAFEDLGDLAMGDERMGVASLWDASPPESPSYSTTLSDVSSPDDLVRSLTDGAIDFRAIIERTKEASEVMWGNNHSTELFLASSGASWTPSRPSEEDLSDFSLASFGLDEHSVESLGAPLSAEEMQSIKRKRTEGSDGRPAKKARADSPSSPLTREDPECKRHTHNVLERKRRNDLKHSYSQLREQIPGLADNERAPTGQILLHAVECINALKAEEQQLVEEMARIRAENERLRREMC